MDDGLESEDSISWRHISTSRGGNELSASGEKYPFAFYDLHTKNSLGEK